MIPTEGLLPKSEWKAIVRSMPIPCVDVIVEKDGKVLWGQVPGSGEAKK